MRRARYFLVIVAAASLVACGETVLDTEELEGEIAAGIEEQTATRNVAVDCPDDVEQEDGGTFECEATAPGGLRQTVEATQTDGDGNVDWRLGAD